MSQFMVYLKSGKSGRNFCANPVNPVPAGFENFKSGAPLLFTQVEVIIGEYLPRHAKLRGKYSPVITETEVNNCFSIISYVNLIISLI